MLVISLHGVLEKTRGNASSIISGQISIIPKPELRGFWGSSLIKPPFRVTSADVVIICPDYIHLYSRSGQTIYI